MSSEDVGDVADPTMHDFEPLEDDHYRPGPEDAGPSGTQRTPSDSPAAQKARPQPAKKAPAPFRAAPARHRATGIWKALVRDRSGSTKVPVFRSQESPGSQTRQPICSLSTSRNSASSRHSLDHCTSAPLTTHRRIARDAAACVANLDKAAYVPMNQYGYMTLMSDYTFLEDMGRKVGDWY
ncbi:hypothetical protein NUW54_g4391 [Trametes sanguinea]|uniref:Uncharacterized protein n=1 Tax=Trametes sanguinea TaxID=158606 RepID=A0ACC1PZB5_9APHY|nr:hypothetical protein NUW54_g4391 [Trametes sanguinea]